MNFKKLTAVVLAFLAVFGSTGCNQTATAPSVDSDTAVEPSQADTSAQEETASVGYIAENSSEEYTTLYLEPDASSTPLARMYAGHQVQIYEISTGWYYIGYEGIMGYVPVTEITFTVPADEDNELDTAIDDGSITAPDAPVEDTDIPQITEEQKLANEPGYVSVESCYVRSSADKSDDNIVDTLYWRDTFTADSFNGYWYHISYGNGKSGYISHKMITMGNAPAEHPLDSIPGYINVGSANIRSTPSKASDSNIIATEDWGRVFLADSFDGYWYHCTFSPASDSPYSGYVSYKMISLGSVPNMESLYEPGYVVQDCNVRNTPSKESSDNIIDTLPVGATFTIQYIVDDYWYYITYGNGKSGFVSYKMTAVGKKPSVPVKDINAYGYTTEDCNIRSTPDKTDDSNIIGYIPKGKTVYAYDLTDDYWYYVAYDGKEGYVSHKMMTLGENPSSGSDSSTKIYSSEIVEAYGYTTNDCNIRSTPDKTDDSNIIGSVSKGKQVYAYEYVNDYWYYIEYNGKKGYISNKMMTVGETSSSNSSSSAEIYSSKTVEAYGYTTEDCNIRSTPDKTNDSNIIGSVSKGTSVYAYEYVNDYWYYVECNGQTGYISNKMMAIDNNSGHDSDDGYYNDDLCGNVTAASCNIRSTPDKSRDDNIIATMKEGDFFWVRDYVDDYWYYIVWGDIEGYVSHKMVTVYNWGGGE